MKKIIKLLVLIITMTPIFIAGAVANYNSNANMLSLIIILVLGACSSFSLMKIYELASDVYDKDNEITYKKRQIKVLNDEIEKQNELIKNYIMKN